MSRRAAYAVTDEAYTRVKANVLRAVIWLLTLVGTPLLLGVYLDERRLGSLSTALYFEFAVHVVGVTVLWVWRRPAWVRPVVLVVYLLSIATAALLTFGPMMDSAALYIAAVFVALLFFGERGAVVSLAGVAVAIMGVAFAFTRGWVPAPQLAGSVRMGELTYWLRLTATVVVVCGGVAILVGYVLRALRAALAKAQDALAREAAAIDERERMLRVAAEAQRLESLGRLAGGVAHDVNNALSIVLCTATLIERRTEDDSVRRLASDCGDAARNAAQTTQQLLTFARQDVRQVDMVDCADVLERLGRTLERLLPESIHVRVDASPGLPVRVDAAQLDQALLNLAINARDAMPEGGVLSFSCRPANGDEHQWVQIEVGDTGCGMDEHTLAHVFEPFFTTKGVGSGTGLGLAMVHGFVAGFHGEVEVKSKPGAGTRIRLRLPLAEPVAPSLRAVSLPATSGSRQPPRAPGRLLVVEDHDELRAVMVDTLREAGFDVAEANSVDAALGCLGEASFELLCTDGVMPGLPTVELIEAFGQANPDSPVLVVTGHTDDEVVRRGIGDRAYALLKKPFTPQELVAAVDRARMSHATARTWPAARA